MLRLCARTLVPDTLSVERALNAARPGGARDLSDLLHFSNERPSWSFERAYGAVTTFSADGDSASQCGYGKVMQARRQPSSRTAAGVAAILLVIILWAALVASLARVVGAWPVLAQAPFYLLMGLAWIIPLKPLVRWIQTGKFRAHR